MELHDKPRHSPENAVREIDGTVFVMNPDTSELHSFSEVGERIWGAMDGERTVAQIIDRVTSEFEVDRSRAEQDALEFLDELLAKGLVELA